MQITCMRKTLKQKIEMNIMICISKVIFYFWLMFLKTSEKMWGKNYHLDPVKFLSVLAWQAALKKIKLELLMVLIRKACY